MNEQFNNAAYINRYSRRENKDIIQKRDTIPFMDLQKPEYPADLIERLKSEYPLNCLGCEHLRALPDRTTLCAYGGSPRKVDVLNPLMGNVRCKLAEKSPATERTE